MLNVSILVPVLNEALVLPALLEQIDASLNAGNLTYEVIAIDDHSTDGSLKVLKELSFKYPLRILIKKGQAGKAHSIIEGTQVAKSELICMIDADLQYPPSVIPEMVKLAEVHGVVVAKRKTHNGSLIRRIGSRVIAFTIGRILLGINVDIQSGLKVFKKSILDFLPKGEITPWALDAPLLHTAVQLGHTIGEVPITFEKRLFGESKLSFFKPTLQIMKGAVQLKLKAVEPFSIPPTEHQMVGAGVIHKQQRFITHTTLHHRHSALTTFTTSQRNIIVAALFVIVIALILQPRPTAIVVVAIMSFVYFVDVIFNFFLILKSLNYPPDLSFTNEQLKEVNDADLPIYSILCPLYREAHILPGFLEAISKLDWPKEKLDVLLLFEEDDEESIEAVKHMGLPKYVHVVVVPQSQPKTKPKACNYGLARAKGEYVVIYDAEDIPDSNQLKKAYLGFQAVGPNVKCLQAKLNYYNPSQNWLTRFFTAEYSLWFNIILTGLQSIGTTIPLGGTSNHFRRVDLLGLEGWDPFNVTEDCDLGVRLFKSGFKTAIIDSTTLEEANSNFKNWIRQRSRWIKGYMQTYLIHMRDPIEFASKKGIHALLFQLTVGGKLVFILINPILWLLTISYFVLYAYVGPTIEALYPNIVFYMAATSLIFGNFMYIYYYMIGCAKCEHWSLVKWVFLIPVYWLMISIAATIALYQLIVKPHYWEKTIHGLHLKKLATKVTKDVVAEVAAHAQDQSLPNQPAPFGFTLQHLRKFTQIRSKIQFFSLRNALQFLKRPQYQSGMLFIAATLIANVLNLATNIYLGSHLSLEEFGVFNFVVSLLYMVSIPINALGSTINYKTGLLLGKFNQNSAQLFWKYLRQRTLFVAIVISLVWVMASPLLLSVFHIHSIYPLLSFTSVWILSFLLSVDSSYVSGRMLFNRMAAIIFIQPFIRLVSSIILSRTFPELSYLAIPIGIIAALGIAYLGAKKGDDEIKEKYEFHLPRTFLVASLVVGLSGIAFFSLDNLLVTHLLSAKEIGQYGVLGLFGKMIFFIGSLTSVFLAPIVARYEGAGKSTVKIFRYTLLSVIFMTLIGYAIFGWSLPLIMSFFPASVSLKFDSIQHLLPIYGLGVSAFTVSQVFVSYRLLKKDYFFSILSVVLSVAQVAALLLLRGDLHQVVYIMTSIGIIHLAAFTFFHFTYVWIKAPLANVNDLLGLFSKLPRRTQPPESDKAFNILIFNWRDTKHTWAGGAELYIHQIAVRLVKMGHKVTVFAGNDGKTSRNEVIDGVQVVRRGGFYTVYVWAFLYYVFKFRGLFDLVIDSENGIPFLTPLFVRKPIFLLIHHVHQNVFRSQLRFPLQQIALFIEGALMPLLYRHMPIITVSASSKKEILDLALGTPTSIKVINPGIESVKESKVAKTAFPSMSFVGRLKPYKNVDIALKAFKVVLSSYPKARFIIAGNGEAGLGLKQLAKDLEINNQVDFRGIVDDQEKARIFTQSWIAVQPSMVEGWGITVIEANAHGTPVIASNVPGLKDSVIHGKTGLLVPPLEVDVMADAIKRIFKDSKLRKSLSQNALEWAAEFNWDKSAEETLSLITNTFKSEQISKPDFKIAYEKKLPEHK